MTAASITARARQSREWLLDAAFPFWLDRGLDKTHGGYHERLNRDASWIDTPKRLRVQARQIYCCAEAARLNWQGPWRAGLESALNLILTTGRRTDGLYIHTFDTHSHILDGRADLYDQAFVLFALAHASKALQRPTLMDEAETLWSLLETSLASPSGGFAEGDVEPKGRRRQNPHMHLFEAAMACIDASNSLGMKTRMQARAQNLHTLFNTQFYKASDEVVAEFFNPDWTQFAGSDSNIWEPGHSFEWSWLLATWRRAGGQNQTPIEQALFSKAMRDGVHPSRNVAIDDAWIGGGIKSQTARLWPQTERLKATLTIFEQDPSTSNEAACLSAFDGLWQYLSPDGFWADRMQPDGQLIVESAPASSLYHILVAFTELARIARI